MSAVLCLQQETAVFAITPDYPQCFYPADIRKAMSTRYTVAIIGAGPGGLSAVVQAAQQGVSHILLESSPRVANTIQRYQKGKHVMAEPQVLPLRSGISFEAGKRETVLSAWEQGLSAGKANSRFNAKVLAISGGKGAFNIIMHLVIATLKKSLLSLSGKALKVIFAIMPLPEQATMAISDLLAALESSGTVGGKQKTELQKKLDTLYACVKNDEDYHPSCFVGSLKFLQQQL